MGEQSTKPTASDTMPRTIVENNGGSSGAPVLQVADSHVSGKTTVMYVADLNILHMSEVETIRLVGSLLSSLQRDRKRRRLAGL